MNQSLSGDTIVIDNAHGRAYQECDKASRNSAIMLDKTLSFISRIGMAEIQCHSKRKIIFEIPETKNSSREQIISFTSIKLTSSVIALANHHDNTHIQVTRCLFQGNEIAVYLKNRGKCDLLAHNSTFVENAYWGIYGKTCANMTVRLLNATFRASPIKLFNALRGFHNWDQHFDVFVADSSFFGSISNLSMIRRPLLKTNCAKASLLNITFITSTFANFSGHESEDNDTTTAPIHIDDNRNSRTMATIIYFNQITIENISTYQRSAVFLSPSWRNGSDVTVKVLNSVFFNNTRALEVFIKSSVVHEGYPKTKIRLQNTIFAGNYNPGKGHGRGAAVTVSKGMCDVVACRFINNHYENIYLTGVIVLMDNTYATFAQCYFENSYPRERALQIFSPGNTFLKFKAENIFNLVKLRRNQPVILHSPPYSALDHGGVHLGGKMNLTCPEGYLFYSHTPVSLKETKVFASLQFSCFQCDYKTYSVERGGIYNTDVQFIKCHDCPRGGVCKEGLLRSKPNFWGSKHQTK